MQGDSLSIRRFRQGFALVAVASLALFAASGCGGSGGGATGMSVETGSLSKTAFVSKADGLCKATHGRLIGEYAAYIKEANPASAAEEKEAIAGFFEDIVRPDYEELLGEIRQLGAPSADVKEVSAIIHAFERQLDALERKPIELVKNKFPFRGVEKLALAYGLKGCAESLS
jgi:hypothetical protein